MLKRVRRHPTGIILRKSPLIMTEIVSLEPFESSANKLVVKSLVMFFYRLYNGALIFWQVADRLVDRLCDVARYLFALKNLK